MDCQFLIHRLLNGSLHWCIKNWFLEDHHHLLCWFFGLNFKGSVFMYIIIHFDTKINILACNNSNRSWNLTCSSSSIESRDYNSSSVMFSRSSCNLKSSSVMVFLDSAKALTLSEISLTFSKTLFTFVVFLSKVFPGHNCSSRD